MKKTAKQVTILIIIITALLLCMSIGAIILDDGGQPYLFTSIRGEEVEIYGGDGIYKYDNVDKALMIRAYDLFYLFAGVPILIIGLILYRKRTFIGFFMLVSSLFYLIYSFIISSIGTAFNEYFLLYMAMYVLSIFAVVILIKDVTFGNIEKAVISKLPRKTIAVFVLVLAAYFIISWLIMDFDILINGKIHGDIDTYTTAEVNVTDLSIYAPLSVLGAVLLLKKKGFGAVLCVGIILMAFQTLATLSVYTVLNTVYCGLEFNQIEFSLLIFALVCLVFSVVSLRSVKGIKIY